MDHHRSLTKNFLANKAGTLAALAFFSLPVADASAYSLRVKLACAGDYYAYCSSYGLDSPELRQCINNVSTRLSQGCIKALVAEGEVSQREVARRFAKLR